MLHYETEHFNLLLVESNVNIRREMIENINKTKLNVTVTAVATGAEATLALKNKCYLCLLMNFDLADMNAQLFLSCIQDGPTLAIPVIVFSQKHSADRALEIIESGAIDFIPIEKCNSFVLERLILYALVRERYINSQRNYLKNIYQIEEEKRLTEEKMKNQHLKSVKEKAEKANLAKSEFLASMSHELRTPLNAILGFTQLIKLDDSCNDMQGENTDEIIKAGNHLLELIKGLLDLEKVESGESKLLIETVDINQTVAECIALLEPVAKNSHITLQLALTPSLNAIADKLKLKQIVINILSNAIKYNVPNGQVNIKIETSQNKAEVLLDISDTGIGIPPNKLKEIFTPFTRINNAESDIEGCGIGLTITKKLVEQMNGTINVESEERVGSRFLISIPSAQ